SFFPSVTKPNAPKAEIEILTQAKCEFKLPICAIGGITPQNTANLLTAGADMIAVISAIFNASSPKQAVQEYLSII
ncbi:MAG: thiamine phosphate synthase, partial [Gammaproteobacteria bacterium]